MINSGIPQIQINPQNQKNGEEQGLQIDQQEVEQSDFAKLIKGMNIKSDESLVEKSGPEVDQAITSDKVLLGADKNTSIIKSIKLNKQQDETLEISTLPQEKAEVDDDLKSIINKETHSQKKTVDFKTAGNETVKISSILGAKTDISNQADQDISLEDKNIKNEEVKSKSSFFVNPNMTKNIHSSTEELDHKLKKLGQSKNQKMKAMNAYSKPEGRSLFIKNNIEVEKSELNNKLNAILGKMKNAELNEDNGPEMMIDNLDNINIEESKLFLNTKENHVKNIDSLAPQIKTNSLNLNSLGTTNSEAIIDKISEHISLQKLGSMESLDLNVNHDTLGQFKVTVSQINNHDKIDLQIVSSKQETMEFFKDNESAMMKSLQNAGVKVGDIKLVTTLGLNTSSSGESLEQKFTDQRDSKFSDSGNDKNQRQQNNDHERGSQKRKELWNHYKQQMSA